MTRIASLDLLRGLAAFAVALSHYLILNSTEHPTAEVISVISVEIFFVLSGFVLAPQIIGCVQSEGWANLRIFLVRRWMRTIPLYLVALIAISLVTGQLFESDFFRYSLYVQNLFHQTNQRDYFPVAWSLSVEEWFYVTFPLLVVLAAYLFGRADKHVLWGAALLLIALVTMGRLLAGSHDDWDQEVRRVTVFRVDSIAFGFCLFLLMNHFKDGTESNGFRKTFIFVSLFVISAVIAFLIAQTAVIGKQPIVQVFFPFAMALFGTVSVATFLQLRPITEGHESVRSLCFYLGRISYSIYLFHLLLIMLLQPSLRDIALPLQLILFVSCLLLFSSIFYAYFERPILASRPVFRAKDSEPNIVVVSAPGQVIANPKLCPECRLKT